jgi:hypothetical protein
MAALYGTIWLSMLLFAAGESARSLTRRGSDPPPWAWWAFAAGLALGVVHTLVAFADVHHWSHADAVRSTAAQTAAIYGVPFGAGIYMNYVFLATWLADAWWWRASPRGYVRPAIAVWSLRAFYMVIIFNAAVVFAGGLRRIAGLVLVSWLVRLWTPGVAAERPLNHARSRR